MGRTCHIETNSFDLPTLCWLDRYQKREKARIVQRKKKKGLFDTTPRSCHFMTSLWLSINNIDAKSLISFVLQVMPRQLSLMKILDYLWTTCT